VGAVIWARPDEQAKHPCFVLAPQHAKELPITNDDYQATEDLETIKAMCDEVAGRYRIDMDRIYTTGQSMGFMCSVELMYRYPDYFGGALLVAGHWDVARFATLGDKNVWVFESEFDGMGFPSATSAAARIEAGGTPIGRYTWVGSAPIEELNSLIRAAAQDGHNFRLTVFPTGLGPSQGPLG
jgi:predicted peptidase